MGKKHLDVMTFGFATLTLAYGMMNVSMPYPPYGDFGRIMGCLQIIIGTAVLYFRVFNGKF